MGLSVQTEICPILKFNIIIYQYVIHILHNRALNLMVVMFVLGSLVLTTCLHHIHGAMSNQTGSKHPVSRLIVISSWRHEELLKDAMLYLSFVSSNCGSVNKLMPRWLQRLHLDSSLESSINTKLPRWALARRGRVAAALADVLLHSVIMMLCMAL